MDTTQIVGLITKHLPATQAIDLANHVVRSSTKSCPSGLGPRSSLN